MPKKAHFLPIFGSKTKNPYKTTYFPQFYTKF